MVSTKKTPKFLRHYTSIEKLHKILGNKSLFLLFGNPKKWPDRNDVAAVQAFCRLKGKGTQAKAICFAEGEEMMNNWTEHAKNGCCIEFKVEEILKRAKGPNFLHNFVNYKSTEELTKPYLEKIGTNNIPFIKRRPHESEKEYRIIWHGTSKESPKLSFEKSTIKWITLSPRIPHAKREKLKTELENKYGITVKLSRLFMCDDWISKFDNLSKHSKL